MNKEQKEILGKLEASFDAMTPKTAKKGGLINVAAINAVLDKSKAFVANIEAANKAFSALQRERCQAAYDSIEGDIRELGLIIRMRSHMAAFVIGTEMGKCSDGSEYVNGKTLEFVFTNSVEQHNLDGGLYVGEMHKPVVRMTDNDSFGFNMVCGSFEPLTREAKFINTITDMVGRIHKQKAA